MFLKLMLRFTIHIPFGSLYVISALCYALQSTDPLIKTLADLCDASTTVLCCYEKRTSEQKIALEATFLEVRVTVEHYALSPS